MISTIWVTAVSKPSANLVQNQVRIGLARLERSIKERLVVMSNFENLTAHHLINSRLFSNQIQDFFARSQLSQFMDQVNPLSEMTHKRRMSALWVRAVFPANAPVSKCVTFTRRTMAAFVRSKRLKVRTSV